MKRLRSSLCIAAAAAGSAAVLFVVLGGSSVGTAVASSGTGKCNIALITHGDNGSFWSVVYKGAKDAARDIGCTLTETYGSQQGGQAQPDDSAENAQIQNAINAHVGGIAVSDHAPSLMNPTLAKARAAGIPVVLLNAGCDTPDIVASGALDCVGQPETVAGNKAGAEFKSLHATNVLCVVHQSGANLLQRCAGIAAALGLKKCGTGSAPNKGPGCTELVLSTPNAASNPTQAVHQVSAYLAAHPGINGVMALNSSIGDAIVATHPKPKVGTFDLDTGAVADIQNGSMSFAIDQQQYLQGYLPVVILDLYIKHEGNTADPGSVLNSGPLLVTKGNIGSVKAAIAAGDD